MDAPSAKDRHDQDQFLASLVESFEIYGINANSTVRAACGIFAAEMAYAIVDAERDHLPAKQIVDGALAICAMTDDAWHPEPLREKR